MDWPICVHFRRNDFVNSANPQQESTEHFVKSAIEHTKKAIMQKNQSSLTVFIGDDPPWIRSLFDDMAIVLQSDRKEIDLAFMMKYCKAFVLTASASTFGFWGAYLSNASTIYYNYNFEKERSAGIPGFTRSDYFLSHWQELKFNGT